MIATKTIHGATPGPRVLITAGVHGDEYEPMAAVRRLGELITPGELTGEVMLAPLVNEPAFRRQERTAEDGLDLARTCPGQVDGSITERIAWELSGLIRTADYYLDLHTGGRRLDVWPLTGYMLHDDPSLLDTQRRMARAFGLPIVWGTDARLEGRSLSVARDAGVPAIYAEYRGGGRWNAGGVEALVGGCLSVLAELAMWPCGGPAGQVECLVEDRRPGAGHMQASHPAPAAGLFEPVVTLGQCVTVGDLLGAVRDLRGELRHEVCAQQAGLVIVLRTCAAVDAGDGLAVVLELGAGGNKELRGG